MQDNRKHIDKAFVDQAWDNMRAMLDQELPTSAEKKKRRLIFGWWGLAILGLLVSSTALGIAYWNNKEFQSNPIASPKAVAVAPTISDRPKNAEASERPTVPSVATNTQMPTDAFQNQTAKKQVHAKSNQYNLPRQAPVGQYVEQPSALVKKAILSSPSEGLVEVINSEQSKELANSSYQAPEMLVGPSLIQLNPPKALPVSFGLTVGQPIIAKEPSKWHYGVEGNGMSAIRSKGLGGSVNFFAAKRLENSRWSIDVGLGYTYLQQPLSVVISQTESQVSTNVGLVDELEYGLTTGSSKIADQNAAQGIRTDYDQPLHLHYATLPIRFNYKLGSRFLISAGAQTAFLVHSKSKFTQGGVFDSSYPTFEAYNIDSSPIKIAWLDLSAIGSAGFMFNSRTTMEIGYKMGLLDVLPNNSLKDKNRMAFFGMRYQF